MKIGTGTAFILALLGHGILLAALVINVSLDKPSRPEERVGKIMHATIVNVPAAKGNPLGANKAPPATVVENKAAQAEAERMKQQAELARQVEAQKKAEAARQKAIALKKAEEAKKKAAEEAKKKAEAEAKAKAEAEAKKKAELEAKKKAEAEAKKKAEAEAKKKAEEEAKKKAEAEAKAKAEAEAKKKAEEARKKAEEARKKAEVARKQEEARRAAEAAKAEAQQKANAAALEEELLGKLDGVEGGVGLGSGDGSSNDSAAYGARVQSLIEQNWRIDPSMNGKRVVVKISIGNDGLIFNESCDGDSYVCASALSTIRLIGMMPMPPAGCKDCNRIVITMTPKL